jgi:hypothetical protein
VNRNDVDDEVTIFLARVRFAVRRFQMRRSADVDAHRHNDIHRRERQVTFTQKWTPAGTRPYYATFAGDRWYKASTSVVVAIIVH